MQTKSSLQLKQWESLHHHAGGEAGFLTDYCFIKMVILWTTSTELPLFASVSLPCSDWYQIFWMCELNSSHITAVAPVRPIYVFWLHPSLHHAFWRHHSISDSFKQQQRCSWGKVRDHIVRSRPLKRNWIITLTQAKWMLTCPKSIDRSVTWMAWCVNGLYLWLDWRLVKGEQASEAFSLVALQGKRSTSLLDRSSCTAGAWSPE